MLDYPFRFSGRDKQPFRLTEGRACRVRGETRSDLLIGSIARFCVLRANWPCVYVNLSVKIRRSVVPWSFIIQVETSVI